MHRFFDRTKEDRGFTLMEMLVVVAIIAILVAVAIPVFNGQLHKAKVASDWANVRAYYAELQMDYLTTGSLRSEDEVPHSGFNQDIPGFPPSPLAKFDNYTLHFLSGQEVKLQAGVYACSRRTQPDGSLTYTIAYSCNAGHAEHYLELG